MQSVSQAHASERGSMSQTPAEERPVVRLLSSGYWQVWWHAEIWAQWPVGRCAQPNDFFHPSWSCTPERLQRCNELTAERAQ